MRINSIRHLKSVSDLFIKNLLKNIFKTGFSVQNILWILCVFFVKFSTVFMQSKNWYSLSLIKFSGVQNIFYVYLSVHIKMWKDYSVFLVKYRIMNKYFFFICFSIALEINIAIDLIISIFVSLLFHLIFLLFSAFFLIKSDILF